MPRTTHLTEDDKQAAHCWCFLFCPCFYVPYLLLLQAGNLSVPCPVVPLATPVAVPMAAPRGHTSPYRRPPSASTPIA